MVRDSKPLPKRRYRENVQGKLAELKVAGTCESSPGQPITQVNPDQREINADAERHFD